MQSLTLDDQDVERLLNCLDGQARLPPAMHSFPFTHAKPPHELVLPPGRTLGGLAVASAIPEYRIGPQKGEPFTRDSSPVPDLSRNAGTATPAALGQQELIPARTDQSSWLPHASQNPNGYWARAAQTAQ